MNDNTIEIYLPKFPKPLLVDIEDYELVVRNKWGLLKDKKGKIRAVKSTKMSEIFYNGVSDTLLHRLINKTPEGLYTDHINGDAFDNRKSNLRSCTGGQNNMNRKPNGLRKFKGIRRYFSHWQAYIQVKGKYKHLGEFHTEEEAARAYDAAAYKYFGNFARYNYPMDDRC